MNRRQFLSSSGAAAVALGGSSKAALAAAAPAAKPAAKPAARRPVLMKLGCQSAPTNEEHVSYLARYGVKNICGTAVPADRTRLHATVDELSKMKDLCNAKGVSVDMACTAAILPSDSVDHDRHPAIMLAESPQRDRDIEDICTMIKNCAAVGIPSFKYNLTIVGDLRIARTPGRGDSTYATWKLDQFHPANPMTKAGRVTTDQYWERVDYFLKTVVPVANQYKVRIAMHPQDPWVPPNFEGVEDSVTGNVEGLKKFITMHESPYHGLNFCQGTVSEMLLDPGKEIFDVIRYFGTRKKIFNVHFRNIRGKRSDFVETYPDEGDIDFVKAIHTYREVGYPYMIMPDHVPEAPGDPRGLQSFAFCYGYIRGLLQSMEEKT